MIALKVHEEHVNDLVADLTDLSEQVRQEAEAKYAIEHADYSRRWKGHEGLPGAAQELPLIVRRLHKRLEYAMRLRQYAMAVLDESATRTTSMGEPTRWEDA